MEDRRDQDHRRHNGNVASNQRRVYRVAGIGFLCLLPLILTMSGRLHLMIGCLRRCRLLTEERDLITENYTKVVEERDMLIVNYTKVVEERDRLDQFMGVWKTFNSSQYFFSACVKTWDEAREDCRHRGADLVIINSQEEQNFIFSFHVNFTWSARDCWIGLSDREQENEWKWVDGSRHITEGLWMPGEPNNHEGNEHCVKAVRREWNDQECFLRYNYACEKPNGEA